LRLAFARLAGLSGTDAGDRSLGKIIRADRNRMKLLNRLTLQFRRTFRSSKGPRVIVFGDSHTAGIRRARDFDERRPLYESIEIVRIQKEKNGGSIGDLPLSDFLNVIRNLDERSCIFSVIGGNQYAVLSTIQHPLDFEILSDAKDNDIASDAAALIPNRVLKNYIESGIRGNDGQILLEIRKATRARVFHILPPPPKRDNNFIKQYHESRFASEGISNLGVSRPQLRLKCWKLQRDTLRTVCAELKIELLPVPAGAVTREGYLRLECYAEDATHANRRYGEMVLKQILELSSVREEIQGMQR
jgi:hypothetical protein